MTGPVQKTTTQRSQQQVLRRKSRHPSGLIADFTFADVEDSLPGRFAKVVDRYGDRVAVESRLQRLTYRQLDSASNRVANAILKLRGPSWAPIAMMVTDGVSQAIASHGIAKANKAFAYISPYSPSDQVGLTLEDLEKPLVVVDSGTINAVKALPGAASCPLLLMDEVLQHGSDEALLLAVAPDTPVDIRYTSGSTGRPKGVVSASRDFLFKVHAHIEAGSYCHLDRLSKLGADAPDVMVTTMIGAAYITADVQRYGMQNVAEFLHAADITVLRSTATAFRQLLRSASGRLTFPNMRIVIVNGEPSTGQDIRTARPCFPPDCVFCNSYGATETHTASVFYTTPDAAATVDRLPTGYAVQGTEILLLDDDRSYVAVGEPGEIVMRSHYLAQGYWRQPDLTAQRFLDDPDGSGNRLYFTGDLGHFDAEGVLHYLGRKDHRVKIRSHWVEISAVEDQLRAIDGVRNAVVVARPGPNGDLRLAAYIEPGNRRPTVTELNRTLSQRFQVLPANYVYMERLPLSATGKVARRNLPDPDYVRPELDVPYSPPVTPIEVSLSEIWAAVLGFDRVGIHDKFLDLGGDSLLASQLITRVLDTFSTQLSIGILYTTPTVAAMALAITKQSLEELPDELIEEVLLNSIAKDPPDR